MFSFLNGPSTFTKYGEQDSIKNILALLMITVVNADNKVTAKEQAKILSFFKSEFEMNENETITLFDSIEENLEEFNIASQELNKILQNDMAAKAKALNYLNSIIICDGCEDIEFEVFEKIKNTLI